MSVALNNVTTGDRYSDPTTLRAPGSARLTMHVRNAAIYYELGQGREGVSWRESVFMPPGTFSGARRFDAVRVRSAVAGVPAQVTIDAGPDE
jgi:hypothetical protein